MGFENNLNYLKDTRIVLALKLLLLHCIVLLDTDDIELLNGMISYW